MIPEHIMLLFLWSFISFTVIVNSFTYDLIDPTPICYTLDLCTEYGEWGTYSSIHPNSEERTQQIMINFARMYPDLYKSSPYGKYIYGTYGPTDWEYDDEDYCAEPSDIPYWWLSSVNQASRFGTWDCANCDSSCGHDTCSTRCSMFDNDCGFGARCDAFVIEDETNYGLYCSGEGLCGANLCFEDGHCSAMFNPYSRIFGIGFEPNTNGITITYISGYDNSILQFVNYSIVNVAHYDARMKTNYRDYNSDGYYLEFMLQYFNEDVEANYVWVVWNGTMIPMDLPYGDANSGFFLANVSIPDECSPYYFIVQTKDEEYLRMPENSSYMFGTAWSNWSWWKPTVKTDDMPARCEENHYYFLPDKNIWVANGGPNVPIDSAQGCQGCEGAYDIDQFWYNVSGIDYIDIEYPEHTYNTDDSSSSEDNKNSSSNGSADGSEIGTAIAIVVVIIILVVCGVLCFTQWKYDHCASMKAKMTGGGAAAASTTSTTARGEGSANTTNNKPKSIWKVKSTSTGSLPLPTNGKPQMVNDNSHDTYKNNNKRPPPVPTNSKKRPPPRPKPKPKGKPNGAPKRGGRNSKVGALASRFESK